MKKRLFFTLTLIGILASCENPETEPVQVQVSQEIDILSKMVQVDGDIAKRIGNASLASKTGSDMQARADQLNEMLVPYGVQLEKMEIYRADGAGQTVFFSNTGNKQLNSDFVPNDPRNLIPGTAIPYIIDGTQMTTASGLDTFGPITSAMNTWDEVNCSAGLTLPFGGVAGADIGFISNFFFDFGGSDGFFPGVIVHAGNLPPAFFDLVAPGGGNGILGVTFTLTWIEDINSDGVGDVAIKEIYYNDAYNWQDRVATGTGVDIETVALHEAGHALSQAHFGKVSRTESNGKIHFSPRAVMNAGYSGVNRVIEKTDKAGHCSNWGNWPNN